MIRLYLEVFKKRTERHVLLSTLLHFISMLIVTIFLIGAGVAHAKKAPDWVSGASKKYPEPRFFIGVGSVSVEKGNKDQQMKWAADRARAEIAKIIGVTMEVVEKEERLLERKDKGKLHFESRRADIITATSRQFLEGVEIKEYYVDKKAKMAYALAVFDRVRASSILADDIERLQKTVLTEMEVVNSLLGDPYSAVKHCLRALEAANDINKLQRLRAVISPTSIDIGELDYVVDIDALLYRLKRKMAFEVVVDGPAADVRSYIVRGLTKEGFQVGRRSESDVKNYILHGTTNLTYRGKLDVNQSLSVEVYQADLMLDLTDAASGADLAAYAWSVTANEKVDSAAQKSAVKMLGMTVEKEIVNKVFQD